MSPTKNDDYLTVAVEAAIAASHIIMEALEKPRVANHKGTSWESLEFVNSPYQIMKGNAFLEIYQ